MTTITPNRYSRHSFAVANARPDQRVIFRPRYMGDGFPFVVVSNAQ